MQSGRVRVCESENENRTTIITVIIASNMPWWCNPKWIINNYSYIVVSTIYINIVLKHLWTWYKWKQARNVLAKKWEKNTLKLKCRHEWCERVYWFERIMQGTWYISYFLLSFYVLDFKSDEYDYYLIDPKGH